VEVTYPASFVHWETFGEVKFSTPNPVEVLINPDPFINWLLLVGMVVEGVFTTVVDARKSVEVLLSHVPAQFPRLFIKYTVGIVVDGARFVLEAKKSLDVLFCHVPAQFPRLLTT
jgi:hypothetical protein